MTNIEGYLKDKVTFTPAVVCYLVNEDQVLLGLRKKVSFGLGENLVAGIGGKKGDSEETKEETDDQAIIREVREEVGVTITSFKQMGRVRFISPHKPKWNQDVVIYLVEQWEGTPQETEVVKPVWFDKLKLPTEQMWEDNAYWVPRVIAGEKVDAIFLLDENSKVSEYTLHTT